MATERRPLKSRAGRDAEVETTEVVEHDHRPWWLRVRSACLLALLLIGLGAAAGVIIGVTALAVTSLFSQALG